LPTADTYTDLNSPNANYGNETGLLLSASNAAGCRETTYFWYKYTIPTYPQEITEATFFLVFFSVGSGTMDLELRSSLDTSWIESGTGSLTWNNQEVLETTVLATSPSVPPGGTVQFSGELLANYLDTHQGQTITLVVRADCDGTVSTNPARAALTKENTSGSAASIEVYEPTAVSLISFTASNSGSVWGNLTVTGLIAMIVLPVLFFVGVQIAIGRRNPR
jgi:hypothetical protein